MNPEEKAEIAKLSASVSQTMSRIQQLAGRKNVEEARFKFPRGYIRTTTETRKSIPLSYGLFDETKIRNICYSLQMADLLRWLAIRTDLNGMLLSQMVKEYVCIHGHATDYLLDASCRELGVVEVNQTKPFKKRSSLLVAEGHIRPNTKKEIDWIWDVRCREHPDKLEELETIEYDRNDANRAREGFDKFCKEAGHSIIVDMFDPIED